MIEHRAAAPVRWYRPAPGDDRASGPTLLWLHGGGFFRGSPDQPEAHDVALSLAEHGVTVATAGACLAAAATLRAIDEDLRPAGAVFAYGFFHSTHPRTREGRQRSRGHRRITHSRWALNWMNRNYAGSAEALSDRLAFPGGHDLDAFPRTLVINAEHDNMRASGDMFATELGAAGVDVRHHIQAGSRHAFLNRPSLDAFASAISLVAAWTLRDEHAR